VLIYDDKFNKTFMIDIKNISFMDAAAPWQLSFSDPATPIMEGIMNFHNDLMFFIVIISIFVLWMLIRIIQIFVEPTGREDLQWSVQSGFLGSIAQTSGNIRFKEENINNETKKALNAAQFYSDGITHHPPIEVAWTVTPALILMIIAGPSFGLLYAIEEIVEPSLSIKCTGHQWYWCYEYSYVARSELQEYLPPKYESYMVATDDLPEGSLRLLEVDKRLVVPKKTQLNIMASASDVLHSWAVPALGIKIDACPGRLNQINAYIKRSGVFYGKGSEIFGVIHGFMPIVVVVESYNTFVKYILSKFILENE